jgi:hypothetical protein
MTFEMCKEMTRRGVAGKGSRSEGCRGAEHGQTCTSIRIERVLPLQPLESAVQLGRGDQVHKQADMANLTKSRDSLQAWPRFSACLAIFCASANSTPTTFPRYSTRRCFSVHISHFIVSRYSRSFPISHRTK